jgi:EPS-associated MarR family transcriptional regulator
VTSGAVAVETPEKQELSDRAELGFRIMRALQQTPKLSQRDLARELGISLDAVNSCLKVLVNRGCITVETFRASDNKIRYAYILTPEGPAEKGRLTTQILKQKSREYDALKAEIAGLKNDVYGENSDKQR